MVEARSRFGVELTPTQQLFWAIESRYPAGAAHCGLTLDIEGDLDVAALERALVAIVQRHPALRTRFGAHAGEVRAWIDDDARAALTRADVDAAALPEWLAEETRRRFALGGRHEDVADRGEAPLVRFALARVRAERHVLLCVFHHLVTDGASMWRLFTAELSTLYRAACHEQPLLLPPLTATFEAFAARACAESHGDEAAQRLAFWAEELADRPPSLPLPTDRPRVPRPSGRGGQVDRRLPPATRRAVHVLASSVGVRPTEVLIAAWATVLHRASGAEDLLIGVPHRNRGATYADVHGCFADTSIVRVDVSGEPSLTGLARRIADRRWRARPHRGLSSRLLFEHLVRQGDAAYRPLYQVMFNHLSFSPADARLDGLAVRGRPIHGGAATVELALDAFEQHDGLHLYLEYDADLFDASTARRLLERFERVLEAGLERPDRPVGELPLLGDDELKKVLVEFQGAPLPAPGEPSVGALLWAAAERHPDRSALVSDGSSLSYAELFARATQVARTLRAEGVVAGDVVAVEARDRGPAIVGILGVLGAGAAYLPIDGDVPEARAQEMMRVAGARALLCDRERARAGTAGGPHRVALEAEASAQPARFLGLDATPEDPAYVLFTSGTSGGPKGVIVENGNVLHQLESRMRLHTLPPSVFLLTYALGFDASVAGLFWTLATGGTLVVLGEAQRKDPGAIASAIRQHRPSHLDFVPTLYAAVLERARAGDLDSVRVVTLGGEVLEPRVAERHFAVAREARLFNEYGPTELTVFCTLGEVSRDARRISIGRLAPGVRGYVLDARGTPVPIGQPGELYLGGGGLARGYVGRPELAAEVFVDDPFSLGGRLYKSGDRVRWNEDGTLEFVGRVDRQVKLRGHRVELSEIEQRVSLHPGVRHSAVSLVESPGGGPMLCAYYEGQPIADRELREHVSAALPPHMIPSAWVHLDALPVGPSGKVDLASLPPPALARAPVHRPPTTEFERRVAEVWSSVLGVEAPGLDDDFFAQGGHSLLAIELTSRLNARFERAVPLMTVFERPTLGALVEALAAAQPPPLVLRALERIRAEGSARPLYFVGSTSQARALARYLDPARPIYGLNIFGLFPGEGAEARKVELTRVARAYIDEIRAVQPRGPYVLVGYCAEAGLALEMAVQLTDAGEEVGFLGFIDGLPYVQISESRPSRVLRNLTEDRWSYFAQLFRRRRRVLGEWSRQVQAKIERRVASAGGRPSSLTAQHLGWVEAYREAMARYEPVPYAGRLTLFLTTEVGDVDLSLLCSLARGGVDLTRVRGYHDTLFEAPHVAQLGEAIERAIARAERPALPSAPPPAAPSAPPPS